MGEACKELKLLALPPIVHLEDPYFNLHHIDLNCTFNELYQKYRIICNCSLVFMD